MKRQEYVFDPGSNENRLQDIPLHTLLETQLKKLRPDRHRGSKYEDKLVVIEDALKCCKILDRLAIEQDKGKKKTLMDGLASSYGELKNTMKMHPEYVVTSIGFSDTQLLADEVVRLAGSRLISAKQKLVSTQSSQTFFPAKEASNADLTEIQKIMSTLASKIKAIGEHPSSGRETQKKVLLESAITFLENGGRDKADFKSQLELYTKFIPFGISPTIRWMNTLLAMKIDKIEMQEMKSDKGPR